MLRSSSLLLIVSFLLTACATIPLPGRGGDQPTIKPPKPLMEGRGPTIVKDDSSKRPSDRVKLETVKTKQPGAKQPGAKPKTPATSLSAAAIKAKLQEAEDKSQSARSLAQTAQTPEDWQLVAQRWTKAIDLLKPLPTNNPQVQQALTDARSGLSLAQQSQSAPKSNGNEPIQLDRSKSPKSQGLIYGDIPSPSPSPKSSASPSPSPKN